MDETYAKINALLGNRLRSVEYTGYTGYTRYTGIAEGKYGEDEENDDDINSEFDPGATFVEHTVEDIQYLAEMWRLERMRVKVLVQTLHFYANEQNYGVNGGNSRIIFTDAGRQARMVLEVSKELDKEYT